ncbi:ras-domain-containing protein [Macrolepiota fuliginosa MF-IS2]|uniref:Ras-domain-containing protein n=1 Tax=Macrolepiota fuliginosa MF-IS2 TaxID=1400762 RepID=A0A9P5X1B2_9AGAR|nr:ras-domain-containing protein [Macrolepiota fuliginosa MF-IS2]
MSTTTNVIMQTIKLVVIGASGVGKTSLRGQYVSGQFTSSYRATIGADFIARTLPHPTKPEQTVTLQIWDTAGQERFSSLSTAFFRGADAVILVFDVHEVETLEALTKWWAEFCEGAPLIEEEAVEYPCFVVGNKTDLTVDEEYDAERIPRDHIQRFLAELIPLEDPPPRVLNTTHTVSTVTPVPKSPSIFIKPHVSSADETNPDSSDQARSSSRSLNKFNTISSINTTTSIYYTPSSSLFSDIFHTARSSPEPSSSALLSPSVSTAILRAAPVIRKRRLTGNSTGSASSESTATITQSLFAREQSESGTGNSSNGTAFTTPEDGILDLPDSDGASGSASSSTLPPPPERGPSLHFTSAKTGEGVKELFEHIAARVMRKAEHEEYFEARRMHYREASGTETIRLERDGRTQRKALGKKLGSCCT